MYTLLRECVLHWLDHVHRMEHRHIPQNILCGEHATGKRKAEYRPRPHLKFKDVLKGAFICLRRILRTRWRWKWIGHVLQRDPQSITRTALHLTPDGKRRRGRPRTTWRRTVESEMKTIKHSWTSLTRLAQDRQRWRNFVAALHTTGCND